MLQSRHVEAEQPADQQPQATSAEAAQNGLNVSKAQTAVNSAQGALNLATTNGQNLANVQQSVIASDQTTLNADNVRYTQTCTATASPSPSRKCWWRPRTNRAAPTT